MVRTYNKWERFCQLMGWWSRKSDGVDHGKMWGTIALVYIMVGVAVGFPLLSTAMAVVIGSLAFGRGMWNKFLDTRVVTSSEALARTRTDATEQKTYDEYKHQAVTIAVDRDAQAGVQPWAGMEMPFILPGGSHAAAK